MAGSAIVLATENGSAVFQADKSSSGIEVRLRPIRLLPEQWEFELSTYNSGSQAVFIMTEPVRSNGTKGSYFTLDPQDPAILNVSVQLYGIPDYSIYSNQTRVKLKRLEPGGKHLEQITVSFPAKETSPPYKGLEFEKIDRSKVREVRAVIGILLDEEGIQDFLRSKEGIGPYARGTELVDKGPLKGKSLYEVQQIIRTPTIKLMAP
jgi:hypothetical protein